MEVGHKADMVVIDHDLDELQSILALGLCDELQNFNLPELIGPLFAVSTDYFSIQNLDGDLLL